MEIKVKASVNSNQRVKNSSVNKTRNDVLNIGKTSTEKTDKADKKEDFKEVLNSKSGIDDKVKADDKDIKEVPKENVDEVEEKIEEISNEDDVIELLNNILNVLSQVQNDTEDVDANKDILNMLVEKLKNMTESSQENPLKAANTDLNDLLSKLTKSLENETLDYSSLKFIEKLLTKLNQTLEENSNAGLNIKNLVNEINSKLENTNEDKTLSLEDMLNRNISKSENLDNKDGDSEEALNQNKSSKDDEILNKFLNKDNGNDKISMFSFRTQISQNLQSTAVESAKAINEATLAKDLIQDVKFMVTNALKELTVKVNPGNLGEITIKIAEENGLMKAQLKANSKETVELIAQNMNEIKKQLGEQNLKIAEVNIELYQEDTTYFKQDSFKENMENQEQNLMKNKNTSEDIGIDEEILEDEQAVLEKDRNISFLA